MMMHIGFVTPFQPHDLSSFLSKESRHNLSRIKGVTATPVSPLIRELLRLGHRVSIFCLDPSVDEPTSLHGEGIEIYVFPKRRARKTLPDWYRRERQIIAAKIQEVRPDILSAQWTYDHALCALDSGIACTVTAHDTPLRYAFASRTLFMAYHVLIAATVIRRSRNLIAVSPYTKKHIEKIFLPNCKIEVIANGLPPIFFEQSSFELAEAGAPKNRKNFVIVCAGGWGRLKNPKPLLIAFREARKANQALKLVLYGRGSEESGPMDAWARSKGLLEGVDFRGLCDRAELVTCLQEEADLMVHPSLIETHGMVLIEAMVNGVPVIAGRDSGAVPWTLGHGKYGYLVDVSKPKEIQNALEHLVSHPDELRRFAISGHNSVKERFQIAEVAQKHLELFETIICSEDVKGLRKSN